MTWEMLIRLHIKTNHLELNRINTNYKGMRPIYNTQNAVKCQKQTPWGDGILNILKAVQ